MREEEMHYSKYKNNYSWCKTVPHSYNEQTKFITVIIDEEEEYRRYRNKFDEGIKKYIREAGTRGLDIDTVYTILNKNIYDSKLTDSDKDIYFDSLEEQYKNIKKGDI